MTDKKILFVLVPAFDPNSGGVQMSTFKLSRFFSSRGMQVSIFSFEKDGHNPPDFARLYHGKEKGVNYNQANVEYCKKVVNEVQPDIVINQMPYEHNVGQALKEAKDKFNFLLLGCLRGSFFAVKLNLETYRTTLLPRFLQPFFKNRIGYSILLQVHKVKHARDLRRIIDTYDYYVLFGPPNREELEYFIGKYKQHKLAYIPNSIPAVVPTVPPKEKRILWLSRLDYRQKHAELILPLWKSIMDLVPDWQFDVVGSGGAYEDLAAQIEREKIPRIKLYGKQKPDSFFSRSPIYVMTSSFEGFPNTLIESQSYGSVPVVFRSYPVIDMIVDPTNAVLVKTFDMKAMGDAIVELTKDEDRRQMLMQKSLSNASRFTIETVGQIWLDFFEKNIPSK